MSHCWSNEARYGLLLLALLPGCLVSFKDYPLEATEGAAATTAGGSDIGGAASLQAGSSGRPMGGGGNQTSGEAGAGPTSTADDDDALIDDFEDGDETLLERAGRSGSWYAANDGQGLQTPGHGMAVIPVVLNPARAQSRRALHTSGGPFAIWGGLIGTSLAGGDQGVPYDVTGYQGIRFWVRSTPLGPGGATIVRFNLPTPATNTGGGCFTCNDHFGADIQLTAQWQRHELRFSALQQEGWGVPRLAQPELERVSSIQFTFSENVRFDLWLDDVEFF